MPTLRRCCAGAILTGALLATNVGEAGATIVEYPRDPSATPIAKAMAREPSLVRRAVFPAIPPSSQAGGGLVDPARRFPDERVDVRDPLDGQRAARG